MCPASDPADTKSPAGAPPAEPPKREGSEAAPTPRMPAAGPHAAPHLTNPDATPGAGVLPSPDHDAEDGEVDAGSG